MVEKRTRKPAPAPFVAGAAAMTEAMLAPAKSAGLVPDAAAADPIPPVAKEIVEAVAPAIKPKPQPAPTIEPSETTQPETEVAASATVAAPEVLAAVPSLPPAAPAPLVAAVEAIVDKLEVASTVTPNPAMFTMASPLLKGFMMATVPETTYAAADKFKAMFGDVNERAKSAVEKSSKIAEDLTELTKGNVEAIVASSRVAAKGAETMTQEAAEYGKKSFESATGAFKSFAAVKSPTELFQLQSEYAKTSFDSLVAEASKLSESMLKLMGEIAQPLSSRYAVAAEKIKSATAI